MKIIYVRVQRISPESDDGRTCMKSELHRWEFCVCSCLVFVSGRLFVVKLHSVCPYQCRGLEEITEQKTMGGLV